MTSFTPLSGAVGGLMIGLAAALLLLFNGRIAGISGVLGGALSLPRKELAWRAAFLAGLILGPLLVRAVSSAHPPLQVADAPLLLIVAGLLVGFGTRLGGGCTSGHGVCGLARLSPRSIAATVIFFVTAAATVFVARHVVGQAGVGVAVSLLAGLIFGAGLAVSQMINPAKVLSFLDFAGQWDPTLAFVMGGALAITVPAFRLAARQAKPVAAEAFQIPAPGRVDLRLVAGSALFGLGWGLVGFCPGPAVAALGTGAWQVGLFAVAMVGGMLLHKWTLLR